MAKAEGAHGQHFQRNTNPLVPSRLSERARISRMSPKEKRGATLRGAAEPLHCRDSCATVSAVDGNVAVHGRTRLSIQGCSKNSSWTIER